MLFEINHIALKVIFKFTMTVMRGRIMISFFHIVREDVWMFPIR